MSENTNVEKNIQKPKKEQKYPINTHDHVDYGGDSTEHSLKPSKKKTPAQRKADRVAYSGD